jgi:ubiquinone/menaquinone biosynthesis C-methylase UbiE
MIADNSIDVIVSNCVLNLVSDDLKSELFKEMFRVLKI